MDNDRGVGGGGDFLLKYKALSSQCTYHKKGGLYCNDGA